MPDLFEKINRVLTFEDDRFKLYVTLKDGYNAIYELLLTIEDGATAKCNSVDSNDTFDSFTRVTNNRFVGIVAKTGRLCEINSNCKVSFPDWCPSDVKCLEIIRPLEE